MVVGRRGLVVVVGPSFSVCCVMDERMGEKMGERMGERSQSINQSTSV